MKKSFTKPIYFFYDVIYDWFDDTPIYFIFHLKVDFIAIVITIMYAILLICIYEENVYILYLSILIFHVLVFIFVVLFNAMYSPIFLQLGFGVDRMTSAFLYYLFLSFN